MTAGRPRSQWFDSYRRTYLERDLRQVANVVRLPEFGRLLTATALRSGQLLNTTSFSRDLGVPLNTVRRHLGLLETTYQIWTVPPFHVNLGKRLVKTPKLYCTDTGLACHLGGFDDWEQVERQGQAGAVVETWVAGELRKLADLGEKRTEIHFWRTHAGREVDFLLARGDRLVAIEVKWAQRVTAHDIGSIMACSEDLKGRLGLAVILYSGQTTVVLNERVVAVPFGAFFAGRK
jgi:predicted AAA+ superfamily ATPase